MIYHESMLNNQQDYIYNCGLPYSEEKYNGSRVFQISTTKEGTAQKYNKSGLPYIEVHYYYPKNENSAADVLEKYSFTSIDYVPKSGYFSFQTLSAGKGKIIRLGTDIGYDLSREDQIIFYYQYKDDKTAFR